jgi:ferrous iron transport protein A
VGDRGRLAVAGLAAGADATVQRLMSMGLIPGAAVEVVRVAPLGDPIMLEVAGYQVSLRRGEAAGLGIERASVTAGDGSPEDATGWAPAGGAICLGEGSSDGA